jgi:hypothetical protein
MMRSIYILFFLLAAGAANASDSLFLFCYFKGRGDGLHYAASRDGLHWKPLFGDSAIWKPQVGKEGLFRDPCIIKGGDGRFHMVWTTGWNEKGIGYAHSGDLLHWEGAQRLPVMDSEDSARNAWAPEITWDPGVKRYLLYWASTVSGRFPQRDTAAESGYNHRIYAIATKDLQRFGKPFLLYDPGFSVIDASIVPFEGQWIMFLKNETKSPVEKNIRISTAKTPGGPYSAPGAPITGNYWAEGPTAIRVQGRWIVYFDKYREHRYGAVSSGDGSHWEDISTQINLPKGIRHGSIILLRGADIEKIKSYL